MGLYELPCWWFQSWYGLYTPKFAGFSALLAGGSAAGSLDMFFYGFGEGFLILSPSCPNDFMAPHGVCNEVKTPWVCVLGQTQLSYPLRFQYRLSEQPVHEIPILHAFASVVYSTLGFFCLVFCVCQNRLGYAAVTNDPNISVAYWYQRVCFSSLILYGHCRSAAAQLHCQFSAQKEKDNMGNHILILKLLLTTRTFTSTNISLDR